MSKGIRSYLCADFCPIHIAFRDNWIISRILYNSVLGQNEDLEEKKLLGSGGYVLAKLTEQEELRASLS